VAEVQAFAVGAVPDEFAAVAIGRARRLDEAAARDRRDVYGAIELDEEAAEELFPFHPAAAQALVALGGSPDAIAPAARLAREALLEARAAPASHVLIWRLDLMASAGVRRAVEVSLGERGRTARAIAQTAAQALDEARRALAGEIVELMVLHHVTGPAADA
jgi:hypothetical protein